MEIEQGNEKFIYLTTSDILHKLGFNELLALFQEKLKDYSDENIKVRGVLSNVIGITTVDFFVTDQECKEMLSQVSRITKNDLRNSDPSNRFLQKETYEKVTANFMKAVQDIIDSLLKEIEDEKRQEHPDKKYKRLGVTLCDYNYKTNAEILTLNIIV